MKRFTFLMIFFFCVNCSTTKKTSHYDSVIKKNRYSSKQDIVDTLRSVANLDKDDFAFISEKMQNVVESYKVLRVKISNLEKKIDRLIANKSSVNRDKVNSKVQILTEEISDDAIHFSDEDPETVLKNQDSQEKPVKDIKLEEKIQNKSDKEGSQKKDTSSQSFIEAKKLYSEKSWQSAITKFQDYRNKNPKGIYIIEATYYMGESFRYLKMLPESQVFYKEIIKTYPTSSWVEKAKQRLKKQ